MIGAVFFQPKIWHIASTIKEGLFKSLNIGKGNAFLDNVISKPEKFRFCRVQLFPIVALDSSGRPYGSLGLERGN